MTQTTIVVPSIGRPSLMVLLDALATGTRRPEHPVVVVDDRPDPGSAPLTLDTALPVVVLRSGGRGPAAARNLGWRHATTPWVSFLDDDVLPDPDWYAALSGTSTVPRRGWPAHRGGSGSPYPRRGRPPTGNARPVGSRTPRGSPRT